MRILLLPVRTAGAETSFSALNRIFTSEKFHSTPSHVDTLMKNCIEGPSICSIRSATNIFFVVVYQPSIHSLGKGSTSSIVDLGKGLSEIFILGATAKYFLGI